jgi:hypothetical protein
LPTNNRCFSQVVCARVAGVPAAILARAEQLLGAMQGGGTLSRPRTAASNAADAAYLALLARLQKADLTDSLQVAQLLSAALQTRQHAGGGSAGAVEVQ